MLISDEAFWAIIQDTWNSTLGFQVDRVDSAPCSTARALTVGVKITGAWVGEVRFECSPPLARLIAAAIFLVETGQQATGTTFLEAPGRGCARNAGGRRSGKAGERPLGMPAACKAPCATGWPFGLPAGNPRAYALVVLAKLSIALASSSWTSKTV